MRNDLAVIGFAILLVVGIILGIFLEDANPVICVYEKHTIGGGEIVHPFNPETIYSLDAGELVVYETNS